MPSLPVLPLDIAGDVHEEGDGKQEGFHNVGHIEEATSIHLGPLRVVEVELQVAIEADAKEEHGEECKPGFYTFWGPYSLFKTNYLKRTLRESLQKIPKCHPEARLS